MNLFIAEMRKIWRPLSIVILVAMGALWAFVGIVPAYQAFDEYKSFGRMARDFPNEAHLIRQYGPLADHATIEKMKADIPRLETQATKDIQAHPDEAAKLGISDFAGYERWYDSVADGTFFPTGAPNAPDPNHTTTGTLTEAGKAAREAKKSNDPTAGMSDEQRRAVNDADQRLINASEALRDLYAIGILMRDFPMTQADAARNLTNSVEMLRSTAFTDKPVTALQRQFERDYRDEAASGVGTGGCATTSITGETVTQEIGSDDSESDSSSDGTASGTGDGTGDGQPTDKSGTDAQLGAACDPNDAALGGQSYRVPGTMPAAVTDRLARYAAEPERSSYLTYGVVEHSWEYVAMVAVFAVVASAALTVPVMVRDRGRRVTQLQWASRSGRGGQWTRLAALAVSSLIVGLLALVAFGTPLAWLLRDFLAVPMLTLESDTSIAGISLEYSSSVPIVPWGYWTMGQWLAMMGACVLTLTLAVTMLGAWLCRSMGSMIRMLLVMVPLAALVLFPARIVYFPYLFLMGNWLTNRLTVPGLEGWLPLGVLVLACAAWACSTWRLRRRELLV